MQLFGNNGQYNIAKHNRPMPVVSYMLYAVCNKQQAECPVSDPSLKSVELLDDQSAFISTESEQGRRRKERNRKRKTQPK